MYFCARLMAFQFIYVVESRVYCQDSHASSWIPFGYNCPVLCQNIINAIERLKIMDFENIIHQQPHDAPVKLEGILNSNEEILNEIETEDISSSISAFESRKKNSVLRFKNRIDGKDYRRKSTNHTIDERSFYKDVTKLSQLARKTFKEGCKPSKNLVAMLKCSRRSRIDGSFLKIMTEILNKYGNSVYKFDEEMTELLLLKIFGDTTDLRNTIFDVKKLLVYLRQALHKHSEHENRDVIAVSTKQCYTVSLPGCFCKAGFVEDSGQCVRPSDCIQDPMHEEYLARIIVA